MSRLPIVLFVLGGCCCILLVHGEEGINIIFCCYWSCNCVLICVCLFWHSLHFVHLFLQTRGIMDITNLTRIGTRGGWVCLIKFLLPLPYYCRENLSIKLCLMYFRAQRISMLCLVVVVVLFFCNLAIIYDHSVLKTLSSSCTRSVVHVCSTVLTCSMDRTSYYQYMYLVEEWINSTFLFCVLIQIQKQTQESQRTGEQKCKVFLKETQGEGP